jgi:hypothetical protein
MSRKNHFLGHVIPPVFWDLDICEGTVLKLTPEDPAYYASILYDRILATGESPFARDTFPDPSGYEHTEAGWSRALDLSGATPEVLAEVNFLYGLCLVHRRGNTAHVSKYAWILYGPGGYFEEYERAMDVPDLLQKISDQVAQLLINYSLPGRWWWLRAGRGLLYAGVESAAAISDQLQAIQEEWNALRETASLVKATEETAAST